MPSRFTVCVLHYGDYLPLAQRVMEPLLRPAWMPQLDLRVGSNSISDAVRSYLQDVRQRWQGEWLWVDSVQNSFKYPMMRRLFLHKPLRPFCMWFDDDSAILPSAPDNWFELVARKLEQSVMIGSHWMKRATPELRQFYEIQPWYREKPIPARINFITGGWWAIQSRILQQFDWPPTDLRHNGGDMALGELLRQNDLPTGRFESHLAINADDSLRCSSARRRGARHADYGKKGWQLTTNDDC